MGWLKIDDQFYRHPKVVGLSDAALALWVRAACWCRESQHRKLNGFIPREEVVSLCGSEESASASASELLRSRGKSCFGYASGLWELADGGWRFHDWSDFQPDGNLEDEIASRRSEAKRRAGSSGGRASAEKRREKYGTAQPSRSTEARLEACASKQLEAGGPKQPRSPVPVPVPVPKREDRIPPTPQPESDSETACPVTLALPDAARREIATRLGTDVETIASAESEFVSYWTIGGGTGKRRAHWVSKLRQHILRQHEQGKLVSKNTPDRLDL